LCDATSARACAANLCNRHMSPGRLLSNIVPDIGDCKRRTQDL
jgi:hypothetical protein